MKQSAFLPELRMLPTELLVPHEECDPRRVHRLSERIRKEGILKNPPIVAVIPGDEKYVVLDGANRVMAFVEMQIPHIVAQLVDYDDPDLVLDTWYHVVSGIALEEFEDALLSVSDLCLTECSLEEARCELNANQTVAYIVSEDGVRLVDCPDGQKHSREILVDIVNAYKGRADIYRASNDIWEKQKPYYPEITALVVFPRYRPADILYCAQNGFKVPTGITRHIIPARALNINIPLKVLDADESLENKREWLNSWLMDRMAANAIRYYAESTFSFNE
ncbi:MAG: hypothetical protein U9R58_14870 [Chloroflexota bacterium]|nr:hypothetical protein [Chloroflexota bacterium]